MAANSAAARRLTSAFSAAVIVRLRSSRQVLRCAVDHAGAARIQKVIRQRPKQTARHLAARQPTPRGADSVAISLGFSPVDLARCRFAISPLFETLSAIRDATGPQGPGYHHRWLDSV